MILPESPRKPHAVFKFGRISQGLRVRQARSQCFGNLGILASYARDAGQPGIRNQGIRHQEEVSIPDP
jgi:hypothetical protein